MDGFKTIPIESELELLFGNECWHTVKNVELIANSKKLCVCFGPNLTQLH